MKFGLSFDFWNTLYGEGLESERHKLRIKYFHKEVSSFQNISIDKIETAFSRSMNEFVHEWKINKRTIKAKDRIKGIAKNLHVELNKAAINRIADYYGNLIFQYPPRKLDNVKNVVSELSQRYPMGIISDTGFTTGKFIKKFLEEEGLLKYFTSQIFSDEQNNSKPHKSLFQTTCSNLGVKFPNLIHIGDLERTDIEGAINAGCKCIRFLGAKEVENKESKANFVANKYDELPDLIEILT